MSTRAEAEAMGHISSDGNFNMAQAQTSRKGKFTYLDLCHLDFPVGDTQRLLATTNCQGLQTAIKHFLLRSISLLARNLEGT